MENRITQITVTGGLKVEIPLTEVTMVPIFAKIVEAGFKLENLHFDDKEGAEAILTGLYEEPDTVSNYVVQQRIHNCLSWAVEKYEMQQNFSEQCMVEKVADTTLTVYQVQLSKEFCDHNDIHLSAYFSLDINGGWGRVQGRVINFDRTVSTIRFVPTGGTRNISEKTTYSIRFHASPFVFRSCDRTLKFLLQFSTQLKEVVFPTTSSELISIEDFEFARRNTQIMSSSNFNEIQKAAIFAIVSGNHKKTPFLLHGPPGTGKTTTLVEAVRLLLIDPKSNARILVCTPSNTAADLFAHVLLGTNATENENIFRMYSLMRSVPDQNQDLRDLMCVCYDSEQEVFGIYPKDKLLKIKVIISTLSAATYLVSGALRGEFTHIIIDEAGQAKELETLIPIAGLASEKTKIVLAGDPKQLGPVESVLYIHKKNLTKSLMERYSKRECYKNDKRLTCMLEENYRSHPSIIKVPSELFYENRLREAPCVLANKVTLCQFEGLPTKGFPIIFHNVAHPEVREKSGHSYCNPGEVQLVVDYVTKVLKTTDVKSEEIGVISPYRYQVRILREKFVDNPELTIDSVERFQGSERRVIIVSTVRSNALGFLDCNRRFNTTITRAEELLIVVGNQELLSKQSSWKSLIDHCVENKAVVNGIMTPKPVPQTGDDKGETKQVNDEGNRRKSCSTDIFDEDQSESKESEDEVASSDDAIYETEVPSSDYDEDTCDDVDEDEKVGSTGYINHE